VNVTEAVEAIKRYAPAALKVTLSDGSERAVAMPKAGNRWSRIAQVLDKLSWVTIESLDAEGKLLGVIEAEEDDAEGEEAEGDDHRMARVLQEVMRSTMRETRLMFDAQLRGQAGLLEAMTEGMRHLSDTYKTALQVQQATLLAPPGAAPGEDGGEVMKMMQMAMMMMAQQNQLPKKEG